MDAKARSELYAIKLELNAVIRELQDISSGLKKEFTGIGCEQCAACVDRVVSQYQAVKRKLDKLDTSTVTESWANAHGGGGGHVF